MIDTPYILFLSDVRESLATKTAFGIIDWRADWCIDPVRIADHILAQFHP